MGQVLTSPKRSVHAESAVSMQCLKHHHHFGACKCHQFGTVISNGFSHKPPDLLQAQQSDCRNGVLQHTTQHSPTRSASDTEHCKLLHQNALNRQLLSSAASDANKSRVPHSVSAYAADLNGNVNHDLQVSSFVNFFLFVLTKFCSKFTHSIAFPACRSCLLTLVDLLIPFFFE